ncbi:DUF6843 domain-containing protein [Metabacillus fastidiosus]|uniref:DUF6843 domain-containing protein n=1 Tax=Metabacillus fastidiosus TaxID=1458 RepID=UPI003D274D16
MILLVGCFKETYTNTIHIVPENFEGTLTVTYDIDGAPKLKKKMNFQLFFMTEMVSMKLQLLTWNTES